jgi:hypothetical protein
MRIMRPYADGVLHVLQMFDIKGSVGPDIHAAMLLLTSTVPNVLIAFYDTALRMPRK